jgi:hypothetical protein
LPGLQFNNLDPCRRIHAWLSLISMGSDVNADINNNASRPSNL